MNTKAVQSHGNKCGDDISYPLDLEPDSVRFVNLVESRDLTWYQPIMSKGGSSYVEDILSRILSNSFSASSNI